ncbi:hypothetical protein [Leptotrichia hofstadii]|uniref:hypothetical protein n=1 Tax=Leptotrichia hofstadii TaxID=157688 RepID=UPI0002EDBCF0|nr:hypothetical protein [Leptotrichia hofstadii]
MVKNIKLNTFFFKEYAQITEKTLIRHIFQMEAKEYGVLLTLIKRQMKKCRKSQKYLKKLKKVMLKTRKLIRQI